MNHLVPDFEMDEDYSIPTTSSLTKESGEDEIMELLWQNNGPVVAQSHHLRSLTRLPKMQTTVPPPPPLPPPLNNHLYMAEDEMAAWLHYPIEDFYSELLSTNPNPPAPLPPPVERPPYVPPKWPIPAPAAAPVRNFRLFSRMRGNNNAPELPTSSGLTVVGSSRTPLMGPPAVAGSVVVTSLGPAAAPGGGESLNGGDDGGETAMASASSASGSAISSPAVAATNASTGEREERTRKGEVADRKRKGREMEESLVAAITTASTELQTEDVELESADEKKHSGRGSTTKRSRAAEVHNLSERRRRDRINEKMKALQELIPRCNKTDKASMLTEAIDYLKSLQKQVQMMSMGCGMVPMMYPGMQQQYMSPMGMGMGMGIDMGMARPVIPFAPPVNMAPRMAPRLPLPPFPGPPVPAQQLSGNQPNNQADPSRSPYVAQNSGMVQHPHMADPYQQYLAFQQMQIQAVQNQALSQPGSSKPTSSKDEDDDEDNR